MLDLFLDVGPEDGWCLSADVGLLWPPAPLDVWFHLGLREKWPWFKSLSHLCAHVCLGLVYVDIQITKSEDAQAKRSVEGPHSANAEHEEE